MKFSRGNIPWISRKTVSNNGIPNAISFNMNTPEQQKTKITSLINNSALKSPQLTQ